MITSNTEERTMSAYTEAVERNLKGLEAVSTGFCPGCTTCQAEYGLTPEEAEEQWQTGQISNEPSFSRYPCDCCGSHLGGDREDMHAILDGAIVHFGGACVDCVMYLVNGDEPETREA
jgi:hypothetical protein